MKYKVQFIAEPKLTFAYGQTAIDPRDGLMLYGPFGHKKVNGNVSVGIIGPTNLRDEFKAYLHQLHKPIINDELGRPNFPGLQTTFGISINFDGLVEIDIPNSKLEEYKYYSDSHQRVHNWVNLYVDSISKYVEEEEQPILVWFVLIPEFVYLFGRPQSRIPKSDKNINKGLSKKERQSTQLNLFFQDEIDELKEAYAFEVNFHNQLKAKILQYKVVTQIIRESKFSTSYAVKDDIRLESAKAWNISTTLYYKLGGLPWKLGDVREKVCYLGLVYKKTEEGSNSSNACCAAQMFLDSGDGMVFRGNVGPWWNPKTKEFHLKREDAEAMISKSLDAFQSKFGYYPEEIFIHARTYFNDDEWAGFAKATEGKSKIIGVRIREASGLKLYRDQNFCVPRGFLLIHDDNKAFLWTKGFIPRFKSQLGLEVPSPLQVEVVRGQENIVTVCKDILALTKLNYNTCIYGDGIPVTLKFADSIGEILTAGTNLKSKVLPFKHYI